MTLYDIFVVDETRKKAMVWFAEKFPQLEKWLIEITKNFQEISSFEIDKLNRMMSLDAKKDFVVSMQKYGFDLFVNERRQIQSAGIVNCLIAAMEIKNEKIILWLNENDPGMLTLWNDRACRTCLGTKIKWARECLACNEELGEMLND